MLEETRMEEGGTEKESKREVRIFETYSRWLDLARICSNGVLLGMIWEDERRKKWRDVLRNVGRSRHEEH